MDSSSLLPGTTPSVGELSADVAQQKRAKSPPLAFERTSNDSLAPRTSSLQSPTSPTAGTSTSPPMGRLSPLRAGEAHAWQVVVDQQTSAIQLLHDAFAAERQAWGSERDRLYQRIAQLEKLLRAGDGYSPARSPILSPLNLSNFASPQSRAITNSQKLPSIAEDEPLPSLSQRRENAPTSIEIPPVHSPPDHSELAVSFHEDTPTAVKVEEIPVSPTNGQALSPPPFYNRMAAGHTPIRAPRPLTPPPKNSMSINGIEDTPTRNNTQLNLSLTRSHEEDEDKALSGPLNMPELPNKPDETNFTLEALSKRLEQIEKHPEESKPMVFNEPSPGVASPANEPADVDENPMAPAPSTKLEPSGSDLSSNALSSTVLSPLSKHPSREQEEEDKVHAAFENGGIRLKKKASSNFGAPFGQLGGFGRKASQDWQ